MAGESYRSHKVTVPARDRAREDARRGTGPDQHQDYVPAWMGIPAAPDDDQLERWAAWDV